MASTHFQNSYCPVSAMLRQIAEVEPICARLTTVIKWGTHMSMELHQWPSESIGFDTRLSARRVAESFSSLLGSLHDEQFGFTEVVKISQINSRQLRNGLDRGVIQMGRILEGVDRWAFTLLDCIHLIVIVELTNRAWVPVGKAHEIAKVVVAGLEVWFRSFAAATTDPSSTAPPTLIVISDDGVPIVLLCEHRGAEALSDVDGNQVSSTVLRNPHIRIPLLSLFLRVARPMMKGDVGSALQWGFL